MIHRADHNDGYLCVLNSLIRDTRISCEACGLLVRMLSMTDDWEFSVDGLVSQFDIPIKTVRRLVKELRVAGYIKFEQQRLDGGLFGATTWHIYESPDGISLNGITANGKPDSGVAVIGDAVDGFPVNGKPANGQHKKYQIKEIPNKEVPKERNTYTPGRGEFLNVYISDLEFEKLTERFGETRRDSLIEDLSRYLENHPKKKYASHYATMLAWARKDEKEAPRANDSFIPSNNGEIDWDRVAQLAMGGGNA